MKDTKFKDYLQKNKQNTPDGLFEKYEFIFPNGYGASVVRGVTTYGGMNGLYELAVIEYEDNGEIHIIYDTPITDDVLGYLTWDEVEDTLGKIEKLGMSDKKKKSNKEKKDETLQ